MPAIIAIRSKIPFTCPRLIAPASSLSLSPSLNGLHARCALSMLWSGDELHHLLDLRDHADQLI
jgi:hypothetical protein